LRLDNPLSAKVSLSFSSKSPCPGCLLPVAGAGAKINDVVGQGVAQRRLDVVHIQGKDGDWLDLSLVGRGEDGPNGAHEGHDRVYAPCA
jgi:hypothetical protein